jgi:PAS domain S-box-containing protein
VGRSGSAERSTQLLRLADLPCLVAFHDQLGEVFFALDGDWRIAAANETAIGFVGRADGEIVGRSYWELVPHARGSVLEEAFSRAAASRERVEIEIESRMQPGRTLRSIVVPLEDGLAVSFRDITEERSAEMARQRQLAESEERLRLAAEAAAIGTWDVDVATGSRRWSAQMRAILGIGEEVQADPKLFSALIDPRDRERVNDLYRRIYEGHEGGRYATEFRIRRANDGAERWVATRGRVLFDEEGRAVRALGALIDVTERKRAEEALRDSEELFRNLAEALPQIVWVMRAQDGVASFYNRRFRDYHGEELGPGLDQRSSRIHPDDRARALAIRNQAIAAGVPFQLDARLRRHDGAYRWHRMSCVPLRREDVVHSYIGAATDIHDMRIAEEALRESEERLRNIADNLPNGMVYQAVREPGGRVRFNYISEGWSACTDFRSKRCSRIPTSSRRRFSRTIYPPSVSFGSGPRRAGPSSPWSFRCVCPRESCGGSRGAPRRAGLRTAAWSGTASSSTSPNASAPRSASSSSSTS